MSFRKTQPAPPPPQPQLSDKLSSLASKFGAIVDPSAPIPLRSPRKFAPPPRPTPPADAAPHSVHSLASRFAADAPPSDPSQVSQQFSTAAAAFRDRENTLAAEQRVAGMARGLDQRVDKPDSKRVASVARVFESSASAGRYQAPLKRDATTSRTAPSSPRAPVREPPLPAKEHRAPLLDDREEHEAPRAFGRAKSVQDTAKMFERGVTANSSDTHPDHTNARQLSADHTHRFKDAAKKFGAS
eukprot:gb/GEZJ01001029.1/.p2 GENE.gb/GEZJ01001029.1/~~gb/GEZJ01001029.1/.p2  ORF type:complete len:263 (+),score=55.85 gb/GEZJ01001029.1/:61-789(+)